MSEEFCFPKKGTNFLNESLTISQQSSFQSSTTAHSSFQALPFSHPAETAVASLKTKNIQKIYFLLLLVVSSQSSIQFLACAPTTIFQPIFFFIPLARYFLPSGFQRVWSDQKTIHWSCWFRSFCFYFSVSQLLPCISAFKLPTDFSVFQLFSSTR